jgi:hypothetical protein
VHPIDLTAAPRADSKPVRRSGQPEDDLFSALLQFWGRWGRGVPANWNSEQVHVLLDVSLEWAESDGSDGTVFQGRRGGLDGWRGGGWLGQARDRSGRCSLVLGYMTDSIEHGFACNLSREAELLVIEMVADGAAVLDLPEAVTAAAILDLTGRWAHLPLRERTRRAASTRFPRPAQPYRVPERWFGDDGELHVDPRPS